MSYFRFLMKSTNQHGVHSPFVFNYITKGLYEKKISTKQKIRKTDAFLLKTLEYFKPHSLYFFGISQRVHSFLIDTAFKDTGIKGSVVYDVIFADGETLTEENLEAFLELFHNDSVGVIDKRTSTSYNKLLDKLLENHSAITLVLNFYWFSLVFIRKEQLKENFFLRM